MKKTGKMQSVINSSSNNNNNNNNNQYNTKERLNYKTTLPKIPVSTLNGVDLTAKSTKKAPFQPTFFPSIMQPERDRFKVCCCCGCFTGQLLLHGQMVWFSKQNTIQHKHATQTSILQ